MLSGYSCFFPSFLLSCSSVISFPYPISCYAANLLLCYFCFLLVFLLPCSVNLLSCHSCFMRGLLFSASPYLTYSLLSSFSPYLPFSLSFPACLRPLIFFPPAFLRLSSIIILTYFLTSLFVFSAFSCFYLSSLLPFHPTSFYLLFCASFPRVLPLLVSYFLLPCINVYLTFFLFLFSLRCFIFLSFYFPFFPLFFSVPFNFEPLLNIVFLLFSLV